MSLKPKRILIVALVCLLSVCLLGCSSVMSEKETYAYDDLKSLIGMVKAPDTFVLRGDILGISVDSEDKHPGEYTFIEYSAANSFGTPLRGVAMFKDHRYIGDMNDDVDSIDDSDEKLEFLATRLVFLGLRLVGGDTDHVKHEWFDGAKFANKLGVEFEKTE